MTKEDIIRMAQEAGFDYSGAELSWESVICTEELERFAYLVAKQEREACAKVCDEYDVAEDVNSCDTAEGIAIAIRARGKA